MAIRRKRKNVLKTSQPRARRQKKIERRRLLLENLEDRRLLAGIPQLAGIQIPGDLDPLQHGDVLDVAPRELVFGFNQAAEIDPSTLGAIQVLQSGGDGTFNRASTISDLNTDGAVQILFTAARPGEAGNGTRVVFTKSDHGNASGPFVNVDVDEDGIGTVTLDLNTHPTNPTSALGIVNAISSHAPAGGQLAASSLLNAEVETGDPLADVAGNIVGGTIVVLAGSNDVVMEPGYVGLGNTAREVVFRFKETLADESYQVIVDGSSPQALKDLDQNVFLDGEGVYTLEFELELGAQVAAVVPQPIIRDSAGALDQQRNIIHVYFNDDDLNKGLAEDPGFYKLIYTQKTANAEDDLVFTPVTVDYDSQSDLAILTFSQSLTDLPHPDTGAPIGPGIFRLRIGTDEGQLVTPLHIAQFDDAGSSFENAQSVGTNLIVQGGGDRFADGQSFDIMDDQGTWITFEFESGQPGVVSGAEPISFTNGDTEEVIAAAIETAINGAGFDVHATRDGLRIMLVNAAVVEHADLVIRDAGVFRDGNTVQLLDKLGGSEVLEVETGFLLDVPEASTDSTDFETKITDGQTFTISNGGTPVTFEFSRGDNVTDPPSNVAIIFAGNENSGTMAGYVRDKINGQNTLLALNAQTFGMGGEIYLGGDAGIHLLDTGSTAVSQSGVPGVSDPSYISIPLNPLLTEAQVAEAFSDSVDAANLTGVSSVHVANEVRVFLSGVKVEDSKTYVAGDPASSVGALLNAPVSIEQFSSIILKGEIEQQTHEFAEPGAVEEPGHREIRVQSHLNVPVDSVQGTNNSEPASAVQYYSFPEQYGTDPQGNNLLNAITEEQKQRAREIFEIYGQQLGITFVEHDAPNDGENDLGFKIVTGDMRALDPTLTIGVGGRQGYSADKMSIMDLQDFQQDDDDRYGGPWFRTAMHEIGHLLGLGHTDELPEITLMNDDALLTPEGQTAEPIYPGDHDLVHGRQLYRPDSKDIDLYRIPIDKTGILRIETFAERQLESSTLDTVIRLYREVDGVGDEKVRELVARNDDYFSEDSRIELSLDSGIYYIGVSAAGNDDYNPEVDDSGYGGKSQGLYELQLTFRPDAHKAISDMAGVALDGDGDGESGGVFNFWFQTAIPSGVTTNPDDPQTFFVDKMASGTGDGSLDFPFSNLQNALDAADPLDIVRLVGNPGADGDITTQEDNLAYQLGYNRINGQQLEDGSSLLVPQGVTVMIDAGAIIKSRRGRIGVGSSSPSIDRSEGALQVLGTPRQVSLAGDLLVGGSVYFTSINDLDLGLDNNPDSFPPEPRPGDWGGIDFRHDIDSVRDAPALYADDGIFLDYVNHAEIKYGGGVVLIDGTSEVVSPIHLTDARPTLTFNTITKSAESAISANPDSFKETTFHERSEFQSGGVNFTSDYSRVGPDIHGNTVVDNSINGLFVRISTPAGNELESLTVAGRFNDNDIVHVITENLKIEGTPGGPLLEVTTPPATLITLESVAGGILAAGGEYNYRIVFVDADGNEENPSEATRTQTHTGGSIRLENLPPVTAGFTSRRLYRSNDSGNGPYRRVAELNANGSSYLDDGTAPLGAELDTTIPDPVGSRLDSSLVIDPAVIVKLDGAYIEAGIGAQLLAEGTDGREIIFTSIRDNRYGTGGTFDTSLQGTENSAELGDWSGIVARPMSHISLDNAEVTYGGGVGRIEGVFVGFNAVEIHQAEARIANSVFQYNADGTGGVGAEQDPDRVGRGPNDQAVIFVRGAQPVLIDNVIRDNVGELATEQAAAISIDVNSLSHVITPDPGRSTGLALRATGFSGNQGALVHGNVLDNNFLNGMVVRGGTLTTEGVWDDTDIVHVVQDLIHVTDFHTYGGLRIESSGSESLVVKLEGIEEVDSTGQLIVEGAGFRADGRPLEIDDRIGGMLHIVGQPRHPVVITSLADDSVAAGYTPDGLPQFDTNNNGLVAQSTGEETNVEITINTNASSNDPDLRQSLDEASFLWGSLLQDPVELVFDVVVGTSPGGSIGAMSSTQTFGEVEYDVVRDAMIADASDSERSLVERLPELIDLQTVGGTASGFINITRANAKALGLDLDSITWNFPPGCFTVDCDGHFIVSDTLMPFVADAPLTSLVLHEVGHALGFVSTLGRDLDDDDLSTLDMFRLEPGEGDVDFTNAPRVVDQGIDAVFYDGKYDSTAHTAPAGLTVGDIPMSTGDPSPPGDGNQPSHFKDDGLNGGFLIGLMDPIAQNSPIDDAISEADLSVLGLIGWDTSDATVPPPSPGDWESIELSTFSHDRNIGVVVEREVGLQNENPETAQVLGSLAPDEKAGDDNLRLGFQVHGQISDPDDVDVYSFEAQGGTEVWLDIDASSYLLDTVVELVNADGTVLFRSDNSIEEAADWNKLEARFEGQLQAADNERDGVFPLEKSSHEIPDYWTTNPRDAGMRLVLPGEVGSVNTYHVRVSSNNTSGRYELQVRLRELDEIPGSTIQYADIRYATNGIEIVGQTVHSPLSGEIREVSELAGDPPLDTAASALQMGNLLETDRAALSIAGHMRDEFDVDFFEFGIDYEHVDSFSLQNYPEFPYSVVMDLDYSDGLARANTSLNVFQEGTLILTAQNSNVAEDRPGPLRGIDMQDLSRGTVGGLDPLLGTVELPGSHIYQIAVTTDSRVPEEMDQFITAVPVNPGIRLEPIPSVGRIVEDHIQETIFSTAEPPQVPVLVNNDGIVPYHIGDVVLFVSQDTGLDRTTIVTVDGFTGAVETTVGSFDRDVGDVDIRGADDRMYAFTLDLDDGTSTDGQAGNYIQINTGNGLPIYDFNSCGGDEADPADDGVQTNHEDPTNPGASTGTNVGIHYDALTYAGAGLLNQTEHGFVVGHRPKFDVNNPLIGNRTDNILFRFDPACGQASSSPQGDRTGNALIDGAGTNIIERGILDTTVDSNGTAFSEIISSEATDVQPDGTTTTLIADGTSFRIDHDGNSFTPAVEFEFNGGPEIYFNVDPENGIFVRDGDVFTLDAQPHEFNTGPVIVVNAQNGSEVSDQETIRIYDKNNVQKIFEFDKGNDVSSPANEKISITNNMTQPQLVQAIITSINNASNFTVQATTLSATSNRITLVDDSPDTNPNVMANSIVIQGSVSGQSVAGDLMEIEETSNNSQFSDAIVARFQQFTQVTVNPDGSRINFLGAIDGTFTTIVNRGVFVDQLTDGRTSSPNANAVNFQADQTAEEIALEMNNTINALNITATQNLTVVTLAPPATVLVPIDNPLRIGGAAPGGDITGMAFIGNTLYAVSERSFEGNALGGGGLFVVNNPLAITGTATVDYIATSAPFLQGIDFQGLAAGPVATEDGLYQDILFGIDSDGVIYAFDTEGLLQPMFVDGTNSVQTGLANITGLQFSTQEENLWSIRPDRGTDAGHGLLPSYDGVRTTVIPGNNSLHFGRGVGSDIDLPGGIHGSFETRRFSLENYSAADQPALYFNYFAETEGATTAVGTMRDSIRVFVGDDSGKWDLLTTNNSDTAIDRELDLEPAEVQETFDNVNQWRQVRADLSSYAGYDNLRLRFDFSTAGEMNVGHEQTTGEELRTIPARDLRDGQTFSLGNAGPDGRWGIAGVDDDNNGIIDDNSERLALGGDDLGTREVYEIDLGFTLVAPSGKGIHVGDQFFVDYGELVNSDFEFVLPGGTSTVTSVEFLPTMTAEEVAQAIETTIRSEIPEPTQPGTINGSSEPNDVLDNAIEIDLLGLSGTFAASGGLIGDNADLVTLPDSDVDMLKIDLLADTRIQVDVDSENYSGSVVQLNSVVRIFDQTGQQLASNDDASAPGEQPGVDSYLEFTAPKDGTYFIAISGFGNSSYDPTVPESGVEGSIGSYDLRVGVQTSGGLVQRFNHRLQLPGAQGVTVTSADPNFPTALVVEGAPGISAFSDYSLILHAGMNQDAVASALRRRLADVYAGGNLNAVKGHDEVVRIIGHSVVEIDNRDNVDEDVQDEVQPFGLTFQMPGDEFGDFNSNQRGQNNAVEGVYIDDIVIGFTERGEMVTGAGGNTTFVANTRTEPNQVTEGPYQLEIRNATSYIDVSPSLEMLLPEGTVRTPFLTTTLDTNSRLSEQTTLFAPAGHQISDGQSFTLFDGLHSLTFEYDDDNVDDGVGDPPYQQGSGVVEISFHPKDSSSTIAQEIRDAINSAAVQSILDIRAASSDGTIVGESGDNRVNLFGNVSHLSDGSNSLVGVNLEIVNVTQDGNLLRDELVGSGITLIGEATRVGGEFSSGLFQGGLSTIGLDGGIVLSTGDVNHAEGPNQSDSSSAVASLLGDTLLDLKFVTTTRDTSSLAFNFTTSTGNVFFDLVFASEEYNERVASTMNDVFAVFIDNINIALVPGAAGEAISTNTINGGNPLGTGASNPQYFHNNNLNDGGQFLTELGYDGFTSVIPIEVSSLGAGVHTLKIAIADVEDTDLDSAVFLGAGSFRAVKGVLTPATGITGKKYDMIGDQNRHREQGQVLIHSNHISHSAEFGIVVDSSADPLLHGGVPADTNLHQGPTRSLLELNTAKLVQGVTITNNVLASNGDGGIFFQGEANPVAAVPFGRIVNNTIVGDTSGFPSNDVGIIVSNNAGPTILNNIVAHLGTGISIDATSEANTVLGGTLYAGNTTNVTNTILGEGDFSLPLDAGDPLFVNLDRNNFYPAAQSKAIDSSINSLEERASLNTVKEPVGIAPSPILAPELDGVGQERVDDPDVATPSGLGQNVFKDRGAIDRSDFSGPSAILIVPKDLVFNGDNGAPDGDMDGRSSIVEIRRLSTEIFEVLLVDGVVPIDPGDGIGIDDSTVTGKAIKLFRDEERLEEGLDYRFDYNPTNDVIRLTALAGAFQQDCTYRVELANVGGSVIEPEDGSLVNDGDIFQVTDLGITGSGDNDRPPLTVDFEFDSGYILQVPQAYTLIVPENGGLDFVDGETFIISDDQGNDNVFEMDRNGVVEEGNFAVPYTIASSPDGVAEAIVSSLTDANIDLAPTNLGDGEVDLGAREYHLLDTTSTTITQVGVPVSVKDGDLFTVDDGSKVVTFEFDQDEAVNENSVAIEFTQKYSQIADLVVDAILNADLDISFPSFPAAVVPTHVADGLIHVGGTMATQIDVTASSLLVLGEPGVRPGFGVRIPSIAGSPTGLMDGQTFTIDDGTSPVTFEFDDNQNATAGNVVVRFADDSTIAGVANELVSVIQVVGLGLEPLHAGSGIVELGGDGSHVLDLDQSVLTQVGIPGLDAAVPVPFIPDESFDKGDMAESIADAINSSKLVGVTAQARIDSVVVRGAADTVNTEGTVVENVSGILDLAGNPLQPNQEDSSTVLTVVLSSGLDYGDAPDPLYNSNRDNNGATHTIVDGFHLGSGVDAETDAKSNSDATGDTDDGVATIPNLAIGYSSQFIITAEGISVDRAGILDAWIDFNRDGIWSDSERVISDPDGPNEGVGQSLDNGPNEISIKVPTSALVGPTFARFRFSSTGTAVATGPAVDGEVEDYKVTIGGNAWHNNANEWDVNDDGHVSPIDALQLITILNQVVEMSASSTLPPVPPGPAPFDFIPPPFLDVNNDGKVTNIDCLLVITELMNRNSVGGEGEGEGEPVELAPLSSKFTSQHLVMAEASSIPRLSDFISPHRQPLEMPVVAAATDSGMDSRRADQTISAVEQRQGLARSEDLDEVLQLIGEEISETRELDGHDEYFARLRF